MRRVHLIVACLLHCPFSNAAEIDFNRDVRPILSDACFTCHGPDAGQRQAELRLDEREGLFRSVDGTTIVDPASAENSELLSRILSDDPDLQMPPPSGGRTLSAKEKNTIKLWIDQGAPWKGHWSYVPPKRPAVPQTSVSPSANDIDRFLQRTLNERKLQALQQADPATLVRRLCFDLTGLPPQPSHLRMVEAGITEQSWKTLVDELLNSHAYAERMTGFWLDLVRYADTNGIHGDNHREVWMYRDWVINAFHRNMPFDQFTIEQLAGDLLPSSTDEQKIASGYNRLLMTTREGGAQPKEYLAKYSADRVRNASTVWLGATMGCCECHDHKFDPYSIRDFYSFAAFFADVQDVAVGTQPSVQMPTRAQKEKRAQLDTQLSQLQTQLDTQTPELDSALDQWARQLQKTIAATPKVWKVSDVVDMKSLNGQSMRLLDDGSIITSGPHPKRDTYVVAVSPTTSQVSAIRLETLANDAFARKSLARSPGNGNFVLSSVHVRLVRQADQTENPLIIKEAKASYQQNGWEVAKLLNDDPDRGWAVDGHNGDLRNPIAVFQLNEPVTVAEGDRLVIELHQQAVDYHNIGQFRLSVTEQPDPGLGNDTPGVPAEHEAAIVAWPDVDVKQKESLAAHYRTISPLLSETRKQHAATRAARDTLEKQIPSTLITRTQKPRTIKVLARGDWMDDSGDAVDAQVPHFLPRIEAGSHGRATRLDLANWFVDRNNPLVARVFVNRLWKLLFGKGIVESADDFGSQGSWPTHPELLDWLAIEFQESGWDVQHMIRLIVSSDAYRRTSQVTPQLREADPFNHYLARQSTYRLDAEFIRDNALSVSGLLVSKVGGRSVKPYQPEGYWAHLNFPRRKWAADSGDDQYRRGLYTYWCRTFLHPAMRSFDAPTREECTVDRPRSNNSLQALVLLNDPTFVEAARAFAERILREGGTTTEERIQFAFRTCLSREATAAEVSVLKDTLNSQLEHFRKHVGEADEFLNVGQSRVSSAFEKTNLAAWASVTRVVLNLHETITRR